MKIYRTARGVIAETRGSYTLLPGLAWDDVLSRDNPDTFLRSKLKQGEALGEVADVSKLGLLAPIGSQEVWAAGVTYFRSRDARMEESKAAGGGSFYDRVYSADRPELFFKAMAHRVATPGGTVRIRSDSKWNVPEPELTLVINPRGKIIGYTIGNDMSSRDIEGENPLYLPQAKVYDLSCGLGPGVLLATKAPAKDTPIELVIRRGDAVAFQGSTTLAQLKRTPEELAGWLYRENTFPAGAYLLTGTGIIPGSDFTLAHGDAIAITIPPIGTLSHTVA